MKKAIRTMMGLGRVSSMPGTLAASVACFALLPFCSTMTLATAICLVLPLGIWACGDEQGEPGSGDGSDTVIDHAVGVWVAMIGHVTSSATLGFAIPALFLFRVFGLLRLFPTSLCVKLPGGWGIMADDIVAGVIANLMLWAVRWLVMGQAPFAFPVGV